MAEIEGVRTEAIIVEGHLSFTLVTLCRASGALPEQVHALVAEGLLTPSGQIPDEWRFAGEDLALTRRALRLARDLDLGVSGAVLVMDLLAQIEGLKALLRRR